MSKFPPKIKDFRLLIKFILSKAAENAECCEFTLVPQKPIIYTAITQNKQNNE